jgi:hypothetical protein
MAFHKESVGTFKVYLFIKFRMSSPSDSLLIVMKPKAKHIYHAVCFM